MANNILRYVVFVMSECGIYYITIYWLTPIHLRRWISREQSSWGQYEAHLGLVGLRWTPCWPHEPCYQGCYHSTRIIHNYTISVFWVHCVTNDSLTSCWWHPTFKFRLSFISKAELRTICIDYYYFSIAVNRIPEFVLPDYDNLTVAIFLADKQEQIN